VCVWCGMCSRLGHVASVSDLPSSDEIFDHARRLRHELAAEQSMVGGATMHPIIWRWALQPYHICLGVAGAWPSCARSSAIATLRARFHAFISQFRVGFGWPFF
jgi:hypothetical protein